MEYRDTGDSCHLVGFLPAYLIPDLADDLLDTLQEDVSTGTLEPCAIRLGRAGIALPTAGDDDRVLTLDNTYPMTFILHPDRARVEEFRWLLPSNDSGWTLPKAYNSTTAERL